MASFIVVITETRIIVLSCSWFRRDNPDGVWARHARATRLGPLETSSPPSFALGGLVMEVDDEYVPVINAADAEITAENYLPPDPLPDR